jgi:hypothetical protein
MRDGPIVVAGGVGSSAGTWSPAAEPGTPGSGAWTSSRRDWYQRFDDVDNRQLDLQRLPDCEAAVEGASEVYNVAADGAGLHREQQGACSVLINTTF